MKKAFTLALLGVALLFSSCQKENIDRIVTEDPNYQPEELTVNSLLDKMRSLSADSINLDCMSIPLPIEFLQASGNVITITANTDLDSVAALNDTVVDFVYPFTAYVDNDPISINSLEDLFLTLISCDPVVLGPCADTDAHILLFFNALNIFSVNNYEYDINYPVTIIVQGNPIILNEDDDYLPAIGGSPFQPLPTELSYPITITQFGRNIILNSDAEVCDFYQTLDEDCSNKPAHIQYFFNEGPGMPMGCTYFVDYPVMVQINGSTQTMMDRDDYLNTLNASPSAYNDIKLIYPVSITRFNDNQQISFNSDSDICNYLDNCN